eukprot:gnl/TRDRNA2_/TRDRNA2_33784_c0_seq1.p1 gnl/TRDRNA2_/TRDRNA2_33784_c0~~gnl/TRDRNA2_/TRDRNA2_33784_c0_seq1.p1  ORF type:complete len:232 (-),score=32.84 gnl/TRDRNA2_/TRDRNA2_33784_c0_seq1:20-715(-)
MALPFRFVALCTLNFLAVATDSAEVVELTEGSFHELVMDGMENPWFVKFYSPHCSHCIAMAPAWAELGDRLRGVVRVGNVNVRTSPSLADDWEIDGYPTLKLVSQGKVYSYTGHRTVDAMEHFARLGWKMAQGMDIPRSIPRPFHVRLWRTIEDHSLTVISPLAGIILLVFLAWTCSGEPPDDAHYERRRAFEEKLAAMEEKAAIKKRNAAASAVSVPPEGAKTASEKKCD